MLDGPYGVNGGFAVLLLAHAEQPKRHCEVPSHCHVLFVVRPVHDRFYDGGQGILVQLADENHAERQRGEGGELAGQAGIGDDRHE